MIETLLIAMLALAGDAETLAAAVAPGSEPADLVAYLAEIRASGMTEGAESCLGTVASIRTGGTLFTVSRDEETWRYSHTFQSTGCALKGTDLEKLAKLREERERREEADRSALRRHADFDGSGFVSGGEGQEFRDLFELGQIAVFVIQSEGRDLEELSSASGLDVERVRERLRRYNALAASVNRDVQIPMPVVEIPWRSAWSPGGAATGAAVNRARPRS